MKATETPGTPTTLAKSISRIEALCVLHFIALLVHALIEREVRATMATGAIPELPLYPEDRACKAPSAARILEIFSSSSVTTCSTRPGA